MQIECVKLLGYAPDGWRLKSRLNGLAPLRHEVRLRGLSRSSLSVVCDGKG